MKNIKYLFYPFLFLLMLLYRTLICINEILYKKQIKKTHEFDLPIISVGNIEAGGTGKTPFVIYLVKILQDSGFKPMVISRGYKRHGKQTIIVHDGEKIQNSVSTSGDEPYHMALNLGNVPIIVSNDKIDAIQTGLNTYDIDVIILDDGFQSRKIKRNLDIVLINGSRSDALFRLIPLGLLREPLKALYRANIIFLTKLYKPNKRIINKLTPYKLKGNLGFRGTLVQYHYENQHENISSIEEPCIAFCGVGDSTSFKYEIKNLGIYPEHLIRFSNHHHYDNPTIGKLEYFSKKYNTKIFITTAKDYVKLNEDFVKQYIIYVLIYEIEENKEIDNLLLEQINTFKSKGL